MNNRLAFAGVASMLLISAALASCERAAKEEFQDDSLTPRSPALFSDERNRLAKEIPGTWIADNRLLRIPSSGTEYLFDSLTLERDEKAMDNLPGIIKSASKEIESIEGSLVSAAFQGAMLDIHQCGRAEIKSRGKKSVHDFYLIVIHGMPHLFLYDSSGGHRMLTVMSVFDPDSNYDLLFLGDWTKPRFVCFRRSLGTKGAVGAPEPGPFSWDWDEEGEEEGGEDDGRGQPPRDAEVRGAGRDYSLDYAQQWIEEIRQTGDEGKRLMALNDIRMALLSKDESLQSAALMAVASIADVNYDKASMRPFVLPFIESKNGSLRANSMYALLATGVQPGDSAMFMKMSADPDPGVRGRITHVLHTCNKGDLMGEASDVVLNLLDDKDSNVARDNLHCIWGAQVSDKVQNRLIEMAATKDREKKHNVFYFGLSTLENKSRPVIQALIKEMQTGDFELESRSRWGLSFGIPDEHKGMVADAFLALLKSRSDSEIQSDCLRNLSNYGEARHLPDIEKFASGGTDSESMKQEAENAIAAIKRRGGK